MLNEEMERRIAQAVKEYVPDSHWAKDYEDAPGLAKRFYAITFALGPMVWGEKNKDVCEALDEELDKVMCQMNDDEWNYIVSHPGLGHNIRGGIWMARKQMKGKPVGTRRSSWEWKIQSPKALDPKYQAALDRFMDNRYWRRLYMRAPEGAKRYYERSFSGSWPLRELTDQEKEETKAESEALYRSLTDGDWDYIIGNTHWGMAKWGLNKNRERYGRKENVQ